MKPIGTYYPIDAEGRVQNRASTDNIRPPWDELVEEVIAVYRTQLADDLHSVWIRGSVPAGTAVEGVSDLDSFAFCLNSNPFWSSPTWAGSAAAQLSSKYPFVQGIEFITTPWRANISTKYPQLLPMIKTQAVQIAGQKINLPGPQPHLRDLKRNGRWIEDDWKAFKQRNDDSEAMRTFIKTFIRGTFEEIMEREGKYATDLYPCIESISIYRPDWREDLEEMVEIFCIPEGKGNRLEEIAGSMVEEILLKNAL